MYTDGKKLTRLKYHILFLGTMVWQRMISKVPPSSWILRILNKILRLFLRWHVLISQVSDKHYIFKTKKTQRVKIDVTGQVVNEQRSFRICRNILTERLSSGEGGGGRKEGQNDGQGTSLAQSPPTDELATLIHHSCNVSFQNCIVLKCHIHGTW